jgi:hypothetical protein
MSQTFSQILQSINNSEIRIAIEMIMNIAGIQPGDSTGPSTLTGDLTGDVTGNLTGNVTGDVTGNSAGVHTGAVTGDVTGSVDGAVVDGDTLITKTLTPVNAVASEGLVTWIDGATQGEIVTIGADVYEIDIDAAGTTGGNFAIVLTTGGGTSKEVVGTALTASVVSNDTQGVAAVDESDGTVTLSADVAGVAGDLIILSEVGDHVVVDGTGTLGATTAGVDGTVGAKGQIEWDATNIYLCTLANTIADAYWVQATLATY